jgi:hypothetical protein
MSVPDSKHSYEIDVGFLASVLQVNNYMLISVTCLHSVYTHDLYISSYKL